MEDVLGPGYEAVQIPLGTDDEGELLATLVKRAGPAPTTKAVL
ncbi:MAG TPA: alpha/beta hydrolase, partial [Methylomirabilota bacterium]|nr:alpha/beta hydrolase [Methylomirabilota bacterium]